MPKQKRILIVRPDRIGDVVLSTPIPRAIKKQFPGSFVAVLLRKYTADIYINNPYVDKIILIDDIPEKGLSNFFKKTAEIRKYKFTHSLTLLPTERLNYLLFFAGIRRRIGVGHKFYQFITFTRYVNRKKYIPLRHEADYCMDLARKIGVVSDDLSTEIYLTVNEKEKVNAIRNELLDEKKYLIGVHSTSGNSAPNWTLANYVSLIKELKKDNRFSIVVTDNNIPAPLTALQNIAYPNINANLRRSILNFAALDYLISASTGPMHIAAALKTKTVAMFCPLTACSPELWGPKGNESMIILPEENYCQNKCPGDPKKCTFEGKDGITVNRVINELNEFIIKSM